MSQPNDNAPGPPPDPLVAAVLRATRGASAGDCPDADVLALYADHALDAAELAQVAAHLPDCARCQAMVAAYVQASEGALPVDWPDQAAAAAASGTGGSWFAGWRWLVPMASLAAVAAVAVWVGRGPANEVAEQARVEAARETPPARQEPAELATPEAEAAPSGGAPAVPDPRRQSDYVARMADRRADGDAKLKRTAPAEMAPMANAANAVQAAREDEGAAERKADAPTVVPARPMPATPPPSAPAAVAAAPQSAGAAAPRDARAASTAAAPAPAQTTADAVSAAKSEAVGSLKETAMIALTGTVTYRARVALVPGAVIDVRLLDVSRADAPATTLARSEIVTRGEQVPVPFTLRYDPAAIQPRRRYVVQATITVEGRVTWRTTTQHPVLVDGAPEAAPVVVVVDATR